MRILFVLPGPYLPQLRAGTESNTDELCVALQRLGHDAAVLAGVARRTLFGMRNRFRCLMHSSNCLPPDEVCGYPVFRSVYNFTELQRSLDEVLRYFRPHVVVAQLRHATSFAHQVVAAGSPAVVYLHDLNFGQLGQINRDAAITFVSNSQFTSKIFRELFGVRTPIIYNLFQPEKYRVDRWDGQAVTFVNPHPAKGLEIALSLAEQCQNIPFLFVGSWLGPVEEHYKTRAKTFGNITWVAPTADMRNIYSRTRILIVPTLIDESWGRVVTEAQFSGIPVLASDRGGLPESVGRGGILLPHDEVGSWRTALEYLWSNDRQWRLLSKWALQHAARPEIRPSTIINQFVNLLEQVQYHKPSLLKLNAAS